MKLIIFITLLLLLSNCYSMEITCYNLQKKIYHGYSKNVYYNDNFLMFFDEKQKKSIYIRAECVLINDKV